MDSSRMSSLFGDNCQRCSTGGATCVRRTWTTVGLRNVTWSLVLALVFSAQLCSHVTASRPPVLQPGDMKEFSSRVSSPPYFRHLQVEDDELYVGAKDYVYRLKLKDISQKSITSEELVFPHQDTKRESCLQKHESDTDKEFLCSNHIRTIVKEADSIYVCGTGAYESQDFQLRTDLKINKTMDPSTGLALCPFDPRDNATAIYIKKGSAGGEPSLYTGTVLSPNTPYPVIYRPAQRDQKLVRTVLTDNNWLYSFREGDVSIKPDFVASHETEEYVHFWFRESSVENMNCGDPTFSRVARVCKNDKGGPIGFEHEWCTYLKARLECAIPGDTPFHFDHIQHVFEVPGAGNDAKRFYAVFNSNVNGVYGSAVCAFHQSAINEAFDGPFYEQKDTMSFWNKVPDNMVPTNPRPGKCVDNTRSISSEVLGFIRAKPIMYNAVQPDHSQPLYYSKDTVFVQIAVHELNTGYTMLFLATDDGRVFKVVQWTEDQEVKNRVLTVWRPFGESQEPIRQMKFQRVNGDNMLYISTDNDIVQFEVEQCDGYKKCDECIPDPYCRWSSRNVCTTYRGSGFQSPKDTGDLVKKCGEKCEDNTGTTSTNHRIQGGVQHLKCQSHCSMDEHTVSWYKKGAQILPLDDKYTVTQDHGLVIWNLTFTDNGAYECRMMDISLTSHRLNVTECEDVRCHWEKELNDWCDEFDDYKDKFNQWKEDKQECLAPGPEN